MQAASTGESRKTLLLWVQKSPDCRQITNTLCSAHPHDQDCTAASLLRVGGEIFPALATVSSVPAPSDSATLLVEVLVHDLELKAGDAIPDHRLKERYIARGHGHDEIADSLKQAHECEWVRWDAMGGGTFFLTEAGFEAGD